MAAAKRDLLPGTRGPRFFLSRLRDALRGARLDRDLQMQIDSHLEEAAAELVEGGLSPVEARRAAARSFGAVVRVRESYRDARTFLPLEAMWRDVRHAVRALRRSASFSAVVAAVLALAIGAAAAVFALLDAVVLQPLPYDGSDRLTIVRHAAPGLGVDDAGLSSALYLRYAEHARSFESIAVYKDRVLLNLRLPETGTERIHAMYASAALFKVLRTTPAIGRLFTEEDGRRGFMNMRWQIPVLISHRFWIDRFGADPRILGRVLTVNDSPREVVGVLPEGFAFPRPDVQMWILLEPAKSAATNSETDFVNNLSWDAVARVRGASIPEAQAELTTIVRGIEAAHADTARARLSPRLVPLKDAVIGDVARVMWLLFGGMFVLLLAACASVGVLFLARAEQRTRETAVRRALGGDGRHLAQLFFIEALLLTGSAAAIGLLLARGLLPIAIALVPFELPRAEATAIGPSSVLLACVIAVLLAAFYGGLSARRQGRSLTSSLAVGGSWATGRRGGLWGSDALVAVQVALALVLMIGSALMVKTYRNLLQRELGFSPEGVLTVEIGLPSRRAAQHVQIYQSAIDRVRSLPNIELASAASFVPLTPAEHMFAVEARGAPAAFKFVTPGYFQTMGIAIVEGSRLDADDRTPSRPGVLISARLARRLYGGEPVVGKTISRLNADGSPVDFRRAPLPPFTIAGVVSDVRELSPREGPTEIVYVPVIDPPVEPSIVPTNMHLVIRANGSLASTAAGVRDAIMRAAPDLSVGRIATMASIVDASRAREAFVGALLLATAIASMALGTIGIYGSVSQVVRRRTREIAIRVALGARRGEVVRMVTIGSLRAVIAGGLVGLAVSYPAVRMLGSLLFEVAPHDPVAFVIVTCTLVVTAGAAALLGARDAVRVPPIIALRTD